jgi:protease-4
MDEVIDILASKGRWDHDLNSFAQVNIADYLKESGRNQKSFGPQIAIVYAEGNIVDGEGRFSQIGGDRLSYMLRSLRYDEDIKGVVIRINSGGGSALASEVISREVGLLSKVKPVAISFGDVAASGGYWIATEAPHIVATPVTITGSIGDFSFMANIQSLANRYGVYFEGVKTGPFAGSFQTFTRPHTDEEMAHLQQFVDQGYQDFIKKVAFGRKDKVDNVEAVAQGRVWSGLRAHSLGLVDELGGLKQAVEQVSRALGVVNYEVVHMGPDYSFYEQIAHYGKSWMPIGRVLNYVQGFSESVGIGSLP